MVEQLKKIVEKHHNCGTRLVESVTVNEQLEGMNAREETVHVFELIGPHLAERCYAWASPIERSTQKQFYTVLHILPIDSPEKAVRAAMA